MNKAIQVFASLSFALLLVCLLIFFYSQSPLSALKTFFTVNVSSAWYFGNMLDKMALLLFASVGISFAFKAGLFNLGGEGQIYLAAFLTSVLLEKSPISFSKGYLIFVFCIVCLSLMFLGFILGLLKAFYNINELISSFLISSAVAPIIDFLILSSMKNSSSVLLATKKIDSVFYFPSSTFNISFVIALFFCIATYLFFEKTKIGYHFRVYGSAKEFAFFSGFNEKITIIASLTFSSFAHALTGFFAIVGTYHLCHLHFSTSFGWNAIAISLIAKNNILMLIPSSLLYAYLINASDAIVAKSYISFDASIFFSAAVFLLISAKFFNMKRWRDNVQKIK